MQFRKEALRWVPAQTVQLSDAFWSPFLKRIREKMIPNVLTKFEETGAMRNFDDIAAGRKIGSGKKEDHAGPPFYDGLLYETIRGVSDFLADQPDPELEGRLDGIIARIAAAQQRSGDDYLNTFTQMLCPDNRWGEKQPHSLIQLHDIYNSGALVEAGIHHFVATGKTNLLSCAVRTTNLLCSLMGKPPKKNLVPAHSLPEEALVKLYRLFTENEQAKALAAALNARPAEYLRLAEDWVDLRGRQKGRAADICLSEGDYSYAQDHLPLTEQTEAMGHAVRATLCYTGLTAVGIQTGRPELLDAAACLWENITQKKMHISGGVGARHRREAFGENYELPNDAYLETCAGVGLCFFSGELFRAAGEGSCLEVFERALCNNVLAAVSADGARYFYENPLQSDGSIERWAWHGCPCCPPMMLKLFGALKTYLYAQSGDELTVNFYIGSRLRLPELTLTQRDGVFTFDLPKPVFRRVSFRVPEYVRSFRLLLNGEEYTAPVRQGFAEVARLWQNGDRVAVLAEEPVIRWAVNPLVEADRGLTAVQKGSFLYCAEAVDEPHTTEFTLPAEPHFVQDGDTLCGVTADGKPFRLIPYYRWCNRGKAAMRVWLPQEGLQSDPAEGKRLPLYSVWAEG